MKCRSAKEYTAMPKGSVNLNKSENTLNKSISVSLERLCTLIYPDRNEVIKAEEFFREHDYKAWLDINDEKDELLQPKKHKNNGVERQRSTEDGSDLANENTDNCLHSKMKKSPLYFGEQTRVIKEDFTKIEENINNEKKRLQQEIVKLKKIKLSKSGIDEKLKESLYKLKTYKKRAKRVIEAHPQFVGDIFYEEDGVVREFVDTQESYEFLLKKKQHQIYQLDKKLDHLKKINQLRMNDLNTLIKNRTLSAELMRKRDQYIQPLLNQLEIISNEELVNIFFFDSFVNFMKIKSILEQLFQAIDSSSEELKNEKNITFQKKMAEVLSEKYTVCINKINLNYQAPTDFNAFVDFLEPKKRTNISFFFFLYLCQQEKLIVDLIRYANTFADDKLKSLVKKELLHRGQVTYFQGDTFYTKVECSLFDVALLSSKTNNPTLNQHLEGILDLFTKDEIFEKLQSKVNQPFNAVSYGVPRVNYKCLFNHKGASKLLVAVFNKIEYPKFNKLLESNIAHPFANLTSYQFTDLNDDDWVYILKQSNFIGKPNEWDKNSHDKTGGELLDEFQPPSSLARALFDHCSRQDVRKALEFLHHYLTTDSNNEKLIKRKILVFVNLSLALLTRLRKQTWSTTLPLFDVAGGLKFRLSILEKISNMMDSLSLSQDNSTAIPKDLHSRLQHSIRLYKAFVESFTCQYFLGCSNELKSRFDNVKESFVSLDRQLNSGTDRDELMKKAADNQ
jgi:hypothetical protein